MATLPMLPAVLLFAAALQAAAHEAGGDPRVEEPPLPWYVGGFVLVGLGVLISVVTVVFIQRESGRSGYFGADMTSEAFNSAGRDVGAGLTASVIVSQWTWAATLLMSSNMGWRVGISGPYWYAAGATVQILLFAKIALEVKRRVPHMHTFLELIKIRFGTLTHCIMIVFALMTNVIVSAMLLLGGAATMKDLTGMPEILTVFLLPLCSCWIPALVGGLKATFVASYIHTAVIFIVLFVFVVSIHFNDVGSVDGTPGSIYEGVKKATEYAAFEATRVENHMHLAKEFPAYGAFIENDGKCYTASRVTTDRTCHFSSQPGWCCSEAVSEKLVNRYCRSAETDCIDIGPNNHYSSSGCNEDERCVVSLLTMGSAPGFLFGIANIVGNFGTVFADQSYWQSALAAKPKDTVKGFLFGGLAWFIVPFSMALTHGLAGRALTTHGELGPLYITGEDSGLGLTPARVATHIMGKVGAFFLLVQLFMAIISTGSAEIIAVASILTYDVYLEYINPDIKARIKRLRRRHKTVFTSFTGQHVRDDKDGKLRIADVQDFVDRLIRDAPLDPDVLSEKDVVRLEQSITRFSEKNSEGGGGISYSISNRKLWMCINKAFGVQQGQLLLRVSKWVTTIFAFMMGFFAIFLQKLELSLGFVYLSMGVFIGSAVGPAALTILCDWASGKFINIGALGGLFLGLIGWVIKAWVDDGEVTWETLGKDWPFVIGNVCSILGGGTIALVGSFFFPNKEDYYPLDDILLVDDTQPFQIDEAPLDDYFLARNATKITVGLSIFFVMLPMPMKWWFKVFDGTALWVVVILTILWLFAAFLVVVALPVWEGGRNAAHADVLDDKPLLTLRVAKDQTRHGMA